MKQTTLTNGQQLILDLLYTYRYGSIELLRNSLGLKNNSGLYQKLEVLIERGYIGKHYKKDYRLRGMPAAYYLLAKSYKALKDLPNHNDITDSLIKYSYKDGARSESFITHSLQIFRAAFDFQRLHPGLRFFTARDLAQYDNFPKKLPDGYLSLKVNPDEPPKRYFLDIIPDGTPRYVVDKLVSDYNDFFTEGGWDDTGSELPALLILTDTGASEKRFQRQIRKKQDLLDMDELHFYTSTLSALKNARVDDVVIWSEVNEPDELFTLSDL